MKKNKTTWSWEGAYKKWFILRLVLLLVVLVLSVGLAYITFCSKDIAIDYSYVPVKHAEISNTPNTTDDVSSARTDWKTYHNDEYSFDIQYPSDYTLNTTMMSGGMPFAILKRDDKGLAGVDVSTSRSPSSCYKDNDGKTITESIIINNTKFYYFEYGFTEGEPALYAGYYRVLRGSTCFSISYGIQGSQANITSSSADILRKIVRTFKFTQ